MWLDKAINIHRATFALIVIGLLRILFQFTSSSVYRNEPLLISAQNSPIPIIQNDTAILQKSKNNHYHSNGTTFIRMNIKSMHIDYHNHLLYCSIYKTSSTIFKTLFMSIKHNITNISYATVNHRNVHGSKLSNRNWAVAKKVSYPIYKQLLKNGTWLKFVVLRDPLERLVSAYVDKVENQVCSKKNEWMYWCKLDFTAFIKRLYDGLRGELKKPNGHLQFINPHYLPQRMYCGFSKHSDAFSHFEVIYYYKETIARDTLNFLTKYNLQRFYYNWSHGNGDDHSHLMFETGLFHVISSKKTGENVMSRVQFYSKYFNKETLDIGLRMFGDDYDLFNISYPQWIQYIQ